MKAKIKITRLLSILLTLTMLVPLVTLPASAYETDTAPVVTDKQAEDERRLAELEAEVKAENERRLAELEAKESERKQQEKDKKAHSAAEAERMAQEYAALGIDPTKPLPTLPPMPKITDNGDAELFDAETAQLYSETVQIRTVADLKAINGNSGGYYILMNDLSISGDWETIHIPDGVFNGNGHSIRGLRLHSDTEQNTFGILSGAKTILNLYATEININFIHKSKNSVKIVPLDAELVENCFVDGFINAGRDEGGKIIAVALKNGRNCTNKLSVSTVPNDVEYGYAGSFYMLSNCTGSQNYGDMEINDSSIACVMSDCTDCINDGEFKVDMKATHHSDSYLFYKCTDCTNYADIKAVLPNRYGFFLMNSCLRCFTESDVDITLANSSDFTVSLIAKSDGCSGKGDITVSHSGEYWDTFYALLDSKNSSWEGDMTAGENVRFSVISGSDNCSFTGDVYSLNDVTVISHGNNNIFSGDAETKTKLTGIYGTGSYNVIEGDLRSGRCIYGIAGGGGHNSIYGNLYVKAVKNDDESYGITGIERGTGNYIKGNITADITADSFNVNGICDSTDSVIEGNITNLYASLWHSFGMLGCTGCVIRGNYYADNGQTHSEAQVIYNCDRCDYYGDVTVKTMDGVTLISSSTSCNLYGNTYSNLSRIGYDHNFARGIAFSTDCSVNGDITTTGVAKGISNSVNCRINGSISGTVWRYGENWHTIIYGGNSCAVTGSVYLEDDWLSGLGVTAIESSPGSFIGGSITLVNEYTRKYGDAVISAGTPYLRMVYCDGCASHRGRKYFCLYDGDNEGHSLERAVFFMIYRSGAETVTPSPAPSQAPDATPTPTPTPTETPTPTPAPKQYIIRLLDKADHTPIEGAEVTINGQRFTSNAKGTLRTTLKEGERNELKVEMAGAEMYRDPSFTPSDGRVTDIYIEQMSLSPDDIDLGSSASDTLHGPSIRFMGSDFELFNVPIDMNFSVLDTVQMEYSASDKTWKAIVGYSQSMSDLKSKKWSKPFADQFDNMKKLYESGKNGGLSKKDFADVNASKDFPGSIAVQGYLEFGLDQYRQPALKTGGLMLMISTGISGSYPIPPAPYVFLTYSVSGTITGEVKLTLENAKYVPSGSLGGETALSGGVGLGANKIASVEGGLTGSLGTKVEFPFESLEKSFEVKAKLDIYMIVSVFVFSHKMSTTLAEYTIYPRSKLSGEDAVLMEINGEEDFTLTPRDYLHSDDAELQGSEGAIKTNLYTYSKVKTGRLSDGRILIVWLDDDPSRTDEDRTALYYCISDKGTVSAPQQINNDGTADFDFDLYADRERAAIVWQNASKKFAGGASMSDMAAATELSYCVFDGNAWGTPIALTSDNSDYEYGAAVNYYSDYNEKYVTWVQNSANDPLCNGGAKESIYRAKIAKDMSVKVEKMYSNLSGVVAAVPNSYGDVAYILDTDGDPTTRGSALYVKGEEIYRSDEDMNCLRSESSSFYFNDGGIMRDASTYSNNVSTLSEKHTAEQKYISPDSFTKIAVFKVNNGFTSDLYATYSDGIPVRITDFGAQIRSWDAVLDENDKLCIAAVLADVEITGENEISETTRLVFTDAKPFEDISLDSLETDNDISRGCSASFTLDVTNGTRKNISTIHVTLSGDKAGVLFDEDVSVMIPSGSSGDITVAVTVPEDFVQQTVTASITPDTYNTDSDGTNNSASIEAGLADLVVKLRQSGIAESGIASVTVENTGCTAAANTAVTLKNDSGAVIYTENIGTVEPNEKKKLKIPVAAKELTFKDEDTPLVFSVWASCDNDEEHDYNNSDACYVSKTDGVRISAYVSSLTLPKGAKYTPSINITGAEDAVIYGVSDNEAVAVVDENGVITAVDDGTAQIVYMTADALMPVRVTLYVHDYGTISISEASYSNTYGGTVKLTANTADCLAEGEKAVMITALYDENGMLLSTSVKDDVTASEAVDISVSYIGQKPKTAKVMLWNAVGEVKPAAKVAEYIFE